MENKDASDLYEIRSFGGSYVNILRNGDIWMARVEKGIATEICRKLNEHTRFGCQRDITLSSNVIGYLAEYIHALENGRNDEATKICLLNAMDQFQSLMDSNIYKVTFDASLQSEIDRLKEEKKVLVEALQDIYNTLSSDDTAITQFLPECDSTYKPSGWLSKAKELLTRIS